MVAQTRSYSGKPYPFGSIRSIDIVVKNAITGQETELKKVRVNYKEDFIDKGTPGQNPECSYADCDTIVWLNAGTYRVSSFKT